MKKILVAAILVCNISLFAQVNVSSSLVACYSFDGNAIEPVNALNGTVRSMVTPTVDRFGNAHSAYIFNGDTSCFIKLPNNPLLKPTNEISFSIWVKPNVSAGAGSHIIYTRNNLNSDFEAYQLCVYNAAPVFRLNKSGPVGNDVVLSTTTVTPGTWYHLVGTINNTNLKLYVNGQLEGTTASSFNGFDYMAGRAVFVGASNEFFSNPFNGSMDNLRFYNRTLNAQEVSALYEVDSTCTAKMVGVKINSSDENTVRIFPNPTKGKFSIDVSNGKTKEYEVMNVLGSLILKGKTDTSDKNEIDLSNYPDGIYFLKIKNEDLFKTIKIVKE